MALIVEDGTGKSDADAYISLADVESYLAAHKTTTELTTWTAASDASKEIAIRKATQALDARFNQRWKGQKVTSTQSLNWPRAGVCDGDGLYVSSSAVPQLIQDATAEMSLRSLSEDILPDVAKNGHVQQESREVGPVKTSTTYAGSKSPFKRYSLVDMMLMPLIGSGNVIERA